MSNDTSNPSSETEPTHKRRIRGKLHHRMHANPALSLTSKIVVSVVGTLVLVAGFVTVVTPGPAFILIPLGLAILASEWDWADRWLVAAKRKAQEAQAKAKAMDPKVRRRRLLLTIVAVALVVVGITGYVATYGWPSPAVDSWDWVQGIAGWMPELPGM